MILLFMLQDISHLNHIKQAVHSDTKFMNT